MHASDIWIETLSSEDVAVVVDFHWFTDCCLEAIFNMNMSRLQLQSPTTVDGKDVKDVRLITGVSPRTRLSTIFFLSITTDFI